MASKLSTRELDIKTNETDIETYERALYEAFQNQKQVFTNIWSFDDTHQRARTLVPYQGQRIVVAEADGELVGAVALNLDMRTELQVEKYGFSVTKVQGTTAEGLAFFNKKMMVGRELVLVRLIQSIDALLRSESISTVWASCDKKHLLGYLQLGFRNVGKVQCNGQVEHLLHRTLSAA